MRPSSARTHPGGTPVWRSCGSSAVGRSRARVARVVRGDRLAGDLDVARMTIDFARMHGCGNDFVVIDDRAGLLAAIAGPLAQALCHRRMGLGGDGLLLIGAAPAGSGLDFTMTYLNADGREV